MDITALRYSRRQAVGLILLSAFFWSTSGLLIKILPFHAMTLAGMRSFFALCLVLAFNRGNRFTIDKQTILGACSIAFTAICFIWANKLTTSANAIVLQYINPVITMLYAYFFFATPIRKKDIIVTACTFLGIGLFFCDGLSWGYVWGNVLALASGFSSAWTNIFYSKYKGNSFNGIILGNGIIVLLSLPFIFFLAPPQWSVGSVIGILYLGIFQWGMPYLFFSSSMRCVEPLDGALLTMVEPLLNPLWVFLVMGELPGILALVGAAIVLLSITLWCVSDAKSKAGPNLPSSA